MGLLDDFKNDLKKIFPKPFRIYPSTDTIKFMEKAIKRDKKNGNDSHKYLLRLIKETPCMQKQYKYKIDCEKIKIESVGYVPWSLIFKLKVGITICSTVNKVWHRETKKLFTDSGDIENLFGDFNRIFQETNKKEFAEMLNRVDISGEDESDKEELEEAKELYTPLKEVYVNAQIVQAGVGIHSFGNNKMAEVSREDIALGGEKYVSISDLPGGNVNNIENFVKGANLWKLYLKAYIESSSTGPDQFIKRKLDTLKIYLKQWKKLFTEKPTNNNERKKLQDKLKNFVDKQIPAMLDVYQPNAKEQGNKLVEKYLEQIKEVEKKGNITIQDVKVKVENNLNDLKKFVKSWKSLKLTTKIQHWAKQAGQDKLLSFIPSALKSVITFLPMPFGITI